MKNMDQTSRRVYGAGHKKRKKRFAAVLLMIAAVCLLTGCGGGEAPETGEMDRDISASLTYESSMELTYAEKFSVDYYTDDYALVTIPEDGRFLVVPEGKEAPEDLDDDITVLKKPLENIYLVASAVMDMFVSLDALDSVRFSALKTDSWYIEEAKAAMEAEDILYAGQYSAPDYERILAENCKLAIENTMIYHTPEVKEQLEKFGIPVMVDYSSYEPNPLGRTEWVKLYGLLTDKEEDAAEVFAQEAAAFESIREAEKSGKTVAFFYITSNGEANVRKSSDYLPKMIEMAGGSYVFDHLGDEEDTASSTISMQMEEFYAAAKDADYVIYNSTIDGELHSVEELLGKSPLLKNFRAVQEGNVFGTTKNLYQSSMELGTIISDIHKMMTGDEENLTYIYRLE
jgi:iron complex transport system substrate-binding protein